MERCTVKKFIGLLGITLFAMHGSVLIWGGSKVEVCLCKIPKLERENDVFIYIGKECARKKEDFDFITNVFKVFHNVDRVMVWNGEQWSSLPSEAKGYTREQMNIFFSNGRESIPTLAAIELADYQMLRDKWKNVGMAKVVVRNERGILTFLTKDEFFKKEGKRHFSIYHDIPELSLEEVLEPVVVEEGEREEESDQGSSMNIWSGLKLMGVVVIGGRIVYLWRSLEVEKVRLKQRNTLKKQRLGFATSMVQGKGLGDKGDDKVVGSITERSNDIIYKE